MDSPLDVVVKAIRLSHAVIGQLRSFRGNRPLAAVELATRAWTEVATLDRINRLALEPSPAPTPRQILMYLEELGLDRISKSFDLHVDDAELIRNAQSLLVAALDDVLRA